jgi:(S)-2-hydroxyglutarate dehydrogenase
MKPNIDFDITVIGAGIVGLATAYQLATAYPKLRIGVLEKEDGLAQHQTGHNSGVIHSGLYYRPGSIKAQTCITGRQALVAFAKTHGIPHEACGKIVVATHDRELAQLDRLFDNGTQNGISDLEKIDAERIQALEPACVGIAGIHVPCTGIIDFCQVAEKLAELMLQKNPENQVLTGQEVLGFDRHDFFVKIRTSDQAWKSRFIINCAGLQSDRIAKLDDVDAGLRIVPFRGDYYELSNEAAEKVQTLIYPVPDPRFPFLGVHLTRTIQGGVECGPNAVFAFKREGYTKSAFSWADTWQSLAFPGTMKLFAKNARYGISEYARSFSRGLFLRQVQRLVPSLTEHDITPGKSGVRAQAVTRRGQPLDDFCIETKQNFVHVLNAPSPAATACLAIGEHICKLATQQFRL